MRHLAGYEIDEPIHRGRQTTIHRGRRLADGVPVVVKLLDQAFPDIEELERLRREHRLLGRVRSLWVVEALDLLEPGNGLALVLQDIGGVALHDLGLNGRIDLCAFLGLAIQASRGLGALHDAGIVHKDISPSNVIWNRAEDRVQIIDLNIARQLNAHARTAGNPGLLEGTLAYMSPEQTGRMNRSVDHRSDLYGLGATLYEALVGQPPFAGDDALALVHAHIARPPRPPHQLDDAVPVALSDILLRLLAKRAEDRYQTARGLEADLERCLARLQQAGTIERFELGSADVSGRFEISQDLQGRAEQISSLCLAFEQIRSIGATRVALITGEPGTGKSTLARELIRPVVEAGGWFVSGHASEGDEAVPYAALVGAIGELVHQILASPDSVLEAWKARVLQALGVNAGVIAALVPDLARITGPLPAPPELSPGAAQARFRITLARFFRVLATAEAPLVVFLDDLQWADKGTLEALELLASDTRIGHLLILAAHRPTGPDHPLVELPGRLNRCGVATQPLPLGALAQHDVARWLAATFHCTAETALPLAQVCTAKTEGNPFFLSQFLSSLHEAGALRHEPNAGWTWNLEHIRRLDITDNVVELMAARMGQLSEGAQGLLRVAACAGRSFDPAEVATLAEREPIECLQLLQEAEAEGLIAPAGAAFAFARRTVSDPSHSLPRRYRFVHDRVRQAAWQLSTEAQRQHLHLALARTLRDKLAEPPAADELFEAVGHYALAGPLIHDDAERLAVAQMCLSAGQQAKRTLAMGTALDHLERGIALLPGDPWVHHYALCCLLHQEAVACAQLDVNEQQLERWGQALLSHSRSPLDSVHYWAARVCFSHDIQQPSQAVEEFIHGAKLLGVRFPRNPTIPQILQAFLGLQLTLATRGRLDPTGAPLMTDPRAVALMDLVRSVCLPAFVAAPNLVALLSFTATAMTVRYGAAPVSGWGVGAYGFVVLGPFGMVDWGLRLADAAQVLQDRFGDSERARATFLNHAFFHIWRAPIAEGIPILLEDARIALDVGDIDGVILCRNIAALSGAFSGMPLPEYRAMLDENEPIFRRFERGWFFDANALRAESTRRLMGGGEPYERFEGGPYDPTERLAAWAESGERSCIGMQHIHDAFTSFILGDREAALASAEAAQAYMDALVALFYQPIQELILALGLLWAARQESAGRGARIRRVRRLARRFAGYAARVPQNYLAMQLLLSAELQRAGGQGCAAIPTYEAARRGAAEHGFPWLVGLATELQAEVLDEGGSDGLARELRWEAWYTWRRWGAAAKAERMVEQHPDLAQRVEAHNAPPAASLSSSSTAGSSSTSTGRLDLQTVLQTSQALSEQLVLADLLDRMMAAVLQNAAARRGLLLTRSGSGWHVEVEHGLAQHDGPPPATACFAHDVVQYVARTGQAVVLGDTSQAPTFAADPYLRQVSPRSLLCLPLEHRGRQTGVLYLENDEITDVFSEDRVNLLRMLCGQIAISIENARLFADQERLARAYERFVPREFLGLLGKSSIVDVQLGDQVEREMTVLFSDIRGFTTLSESMSPAKTFAFINEFLSIMEPVCTRCHGFVDKYVGDGIMALFPTGADDALAAAVGMVEELGRFNARRAEQGLPAVRVGIGLNSGLLMLGTVGGPDRMDGTVISDAVNLASRVEGLNRVFGTTILISERTYTHLREADRFELRAIGRVRVKGKTTPVSVMEVLEGDSREIREMKRETRPDFDEALAAYTKKDFQAAAEIFGTVLRWNPSDAVANRYLQRCRRFAEHGVPPDWDGVEDMEGK